MNYTSLIQSAKVYDVAIRSPLEYASKLSERLNQHVWFKREDLQAVFSFKLRGAYNKIANLSDAECKAGVLCASAGNHAQGVALAARKRHCKATIVMPNTTPDIKVRSVRNMGATVIQHGDSYFEASIKAMELAEQKNMTFVHPYDDKWVIAGQGTVGKEICEQMDEKIHAIFVPIGGGGLISGIAAWVKENSPDTAIIGVEPEDASAMYQSIAAGHRVVLDQVGIFADGVAVKEVGSLTFDLVRELVDNIILVNTDEICAAIKDGFDENRSILEPAGALAIAGIKKFSANASGSSMNLVAVNSGANMNFDRLRHVAERAEIGENKEALFAVTIPEQPGSFLKFCQILGDRTLTEFNYRLSGRNDAHIFVGIGINNKEDIAQIEHSLGDKGYPFTNLSDNELAKIHVRHMVGGRSSEARQERLYRFEFPERPGALLDFLSKLANRWNISLFHYRNHGAAFGRVLVGIEVPDGDHHEFEKFLNDVAYTYTDESDNHAFSLFL